MYETNSIIIDSMISKDNPSLITVHNNSSNYESFTYIKSEQTNESIKIIQCKELNIIKLSKSFFYNFPNLEFIDIRNNNILKLSNKFKLFKNLTTLKTDCNSITIVPIWLNEFKTMTHLSMSNNYLRYFPSAITKMKALTYLDVSSNKIESLPIELGELNHMETLIINNNYYTEIPTSIGNMLDLKKISLEWFQFIERTHPHEVTVLSKEDLLQKFLLFMKKMLWSDNNPFCSFTSFVTNFNRSDPNINPLNDNKMLSAVEMNYYGIVKDYIINNKSFMQVQNNDNKTMLYLSFDYKMTDLCKLLIQNTDIAKLHKRQYYLNKAIRFYNFELAESLLESNADFNEADADGNTPFHILFSVFNEDVLKSCRIGEVLIKYNLKGRNQLNNFGFGPVHIAIKKSNLQCLKWIRKANDYLRKNSKKEFNFDLPGKDGWSPLHFTVNDYKVEETLFLYNSGCNLFQKNKKNYTPRQVADGNYLLSKFLLKEEKIKMEQIYCENNSQRKSDEVLNNTSYHRARIAKTRELLLSLGALSSFKNDKYDLYLKLNDNSSFMIEHVIRNKLRDYKVSSKELLIKKLTNISDMCQMIILFNLQELVPLLKSLKDLYKKSKMIVCEISNTIMILTMINSHKNPGDAHLPMHPRPKMNWIIREYTNTSHCNSNGNGNNDSLGNVSKDYDSLTYHHNFMQMPKKNKGDISSVNNSMTSIISIGNNKNKTLSKTKLSNKKLVNTHLSFSIINTSTSNNHTNTTNVSNKNIKNTRKSKSIDPMKSIKLF